MSLAEPNTLAKLRYIDRAAKEIELLNVFSSSFLNNNMPCDIFSCSRWW